MNIEQRKQIKSLKHLIRDSITERNSLQNDSLFYPSKMWKYANELFSFLQYLPTKELESIRLHTTAFTGESLFDFIYHPDRDSTDQNKESTFMACAQYNKITQNIPINYHISEPTPNLLTEKLSLPYKNIFISNNLIRYQRFIINLYNLGIMNYLGNNKANIILEVGGGYGQLTHHIRAILKTGTYILVDTPEILFWAGVYLIINNPNERIFIYDANKHKTALTEDIIRKYDFILIPNYKLLDVIGNINLNLAFNLLSFAEMTEPQIRFYCKYISNNLKGYICSDNVEIHRYNKELKRSTDSILREYFQMFPSELDSKKLQERMSPDIWQIYSYFGISKQSSIQINSINNVILGSNYKFKYKSVEFYESVIDSTN